MGVILSGSLRFAVAAVCCLAACSVQGRSQAFTCDTDMDCNGRECQDGFCVVVGGPDSGAENPGDDAALPPQIDASPDCPGACTSCDGNTCFIDCLSQGSCSEQVVCPVGMDCNVRCTQRDTCTAGINCADASSCTIECSGRESCSAVTCGSGQCDVQCTGRDSCSGGVQCSSSCACDVQCTGNNPCETPATCPLSPEQTCVSGDGCTSASDENCSNCEEGGDR